MGKVQECGTVRVRLATERDVPEALRLENECFTGYYARHRYQRAEFLAHLRGKQAILLVATRDGALVGYLAGSIRRSHSYLSAYVDSIAVVPAHRRSGVGGRLMRRFIQYARRRRCRRVSLHVAVPNQAGIRFFANRGFRRVRILPGHYGRKIDGALMSRNIYIRGGA